MSISCSPTHFSSLESEYFASNSLITILPMFSSKPLQFIEGQYGPFRPQLPISVPLWLGIQLKKANKCQIKIPQWMELEALTEQLAQEQNSMQFAAIPFHFDEIARLIIQNARDDLTSPHRIEELLADIRDVRASKVRAALQNLQLASAVLPLGEIAAMELNSIRDAVAHSLEVFHDLRHPEPAAVAGSASGVAADSHRGGVIQPADEKSREIQFQGNYRTQQQSQSQQPNPSQDVGELAGSQSADPVLSQSSNANADPEPQKKLRKFR